MATAVNEAVLEPRGRRSVRARWLAGLAALTTTVVAVATIGLGSDHAPAPAPATNYSAPASSMLYSPEEMIVKRLASGGQIPPETMDSRSFVIKSLINRGLIPRDTIDGGGSLIDRLVNKGLVPPQAGDARAAGR